MEMMMKQFNPDDIAYMANGRKVQVVATKRASYIVQLGFHDEESGEEWFDGAKEVDVLFANPPVETKAASILELEETERGLRKTIAALYADAETARTAVADTLKRWQTYSALEHIDDYLNGKITHFVFLEYSGVEIMERDKALDEDPDRKWDKRQKLLCLFGDAKGNLQWRLNHYRDGSGSWAYVWPCRSYEEAIAKATEAVNDRFDEWRKDRNKGWPSYTASSARRLGIAIPDDVAAFLRDAGIKNAQSRLDKAKTDLANAEAALAKAKGEA